MSALSSTSEHPSRAGASSFALKLAAIAGMTANHACHIFSGYLPAEAFAVLFGFGGLTFPIMAFLLVEGYRHTSNLRRYAARLLVFALVSQVPYALFLADDLNVLFTLLIGLALLRLNDTVERRALFWAAVAALTAVSALCDWGVLGPVMILMMRLVPDRRERVVYPLLLPIAGMGLPTLSELASNPGLETLGQALYPLAGCTACIPLLLAYNGRRGRPLKWLFYAYYPAHILVLGVAKGLLLGDWSPVS
ncbi:TraX family protein [Rubneribacter sp.]